MHSKNACALACALYLLYREYNLVKNRDGIKRKRLIKFIQMTPEKNIHILNYDGTDYVVYKAGHTIVIIDDRGTNGKVWGRFRRMVFRRDSYSCKICGNNDRKVLKCHHIKSVKDFPNLYYDIDNVVTLCDDCHKYLKLKEVEMPFIALDNNNK